MVMKKRYIFAFSCPFSSLLDHLSWFQFHSVSCFLNTHSIRHSDDIRNMVSLLCISSIKLLQNLDVGPFVWQPCTTRWGQNPVHKTNIKILYKLNFLSATIKLLYNYTRSHLFFVGSYSLAGISLDVPPFLVPGNFLPWPACPLSFHLLSLCCFSLRTGQLCQNARICSC